jgi:hypothetical protein
VVKTEDLVSLLATRADAEKTQAPVRRYAVAVLGATALATLLTAELLGVRSTLVRDFSMPMFWTKEAFCATLGAAGLVAAARLARPGSRLGWVRVGLAGPLLAMWLLAATALLMAGAQDRSALIFGDTASACPFLIALIAAPLFVAIFWAMRGFAPTRLRLAGAAGGTAAGAMGALVYSLHCPELAAPFLGIWYVLGILIPTTVGALLGPCLLRW